MLFDFSKAFVLIENFEYAEENWRLRQEFVKFLRQLLNFLVANFSYLPQAFNEFLPQA